MIVTVYNDDGSQPNKYSFTDQVVYLGRNPTKEEAVVIDSQTVSRNHLKAKVKQATNKILIRDLDSSKDKGK